MVSIREAVESVYKKNKKIDVDYLKKEFPNTNPKSLSNALSMARRLFPDTEGEPKPFTKITEEVTEQVILKLLNKGIDKVNVRMMIDFLKIKQKDSGLDDDLDVSKYLKKVGL